MSQAIKFVSEYLMGISEMFAGVYESRDIEIQNIKKEFYQGLNDSVFEDKKKLQNDLSNIGKDFKKAYNSHELVQKNG